MTEQPELTPEELEWINQTRAASQEYEQSRNRLRAAGERVRIAEEMRRAAIAEMGQVYRDHRAFAQTSGRPGYRIDMEQGEGLTEVSRRTLSTAIANPGRISDQELAQQYRDYGYDMHYGGYELHRRYPWLAGMHAAHMALWGAQIDAEADKQSIEDLLAPVSEIVVPPGADVLKRLYESAVDVIADGEASGRSINLEFWA